MNSFSPYKTSKSNASQIKSFKSVTPNSLSKLSTILNSPVNNQCNIFNYSPIKVNNIINFTFDSNDRPRTPKKTAKIKKCIKSEKIFIPRKLPTEPNRNLKYTEFKSYHETSLKKKSKFLIKNKPSLFTTIKIKRPETEEHKKDMEKKEDSFAAYTIYDKPALTYLEKLFRLNQVSIFN